MAARDLGRFRAAQDRRDSGFECALAEINAGQKRSHWIWYVFPQLSGLGVSQMSEMYAIGDLDEAERYVRDPVLGARLLTITTAAAEQLQQGVGVETLMGSETDARKLVSSLTLFEAVAKHLNETGPAGMSRELAEAAGRVLARAESAGFPRCRHTLEYVRGAR